MPNKPTPKSQVNEKTTNTSAKPPEQQKQLFSNFDITLGVLALFLGVALYVWQYANIGIVGKLLWAYKPIQVYGSSGWGIANMLNWLFYAMIALCYGIVIYLVGKAIIFYWPKIPIKWAAKLETKKHFKVWIYLVIIVAPILFTQIMDVNHLWYLKNHPDANANLPPLPQSTSQQLSSIEQSLNQEEQQLQQLTNDIDKLIIQMQANDSTTTTTNK